MEKLNQIEIGGVTYDLQDPDATANIQSSFNCKSHVGMVIQSTKLDTEEKVIAIYGGTQWEKIEGRMLLGSSETYAVDSTGGSADAIVPYHNHSIPALSGTAASAGAHSHKVDTYAYSGGYSSYGIAHSQKGTWVNNPYTSSDGAHTHSVTTTANNTGYVGTSGNTTGANMPPYKVVHIWERIA